MIKSLVSPKLQHARSRRTLEAKRDQLLITVAKSAQELKKVRLDLKTHNSNRPK